MISIIFSYVVPHLLVNESPGTASAELGDSAIGVTPHGPISTFSFTGTASAELVCLEFVLMQC